MFFFQAEDGIRYRNVTGVQTCALPIFEGFNLCRNWCRASTAKRPRLKPSTQPSTLPLQRSEERRVGKECSFLWVGEQEKKKRISAHYKFYVWFMDQSQIVHFDHLSQIE